MSKPAAIRLRYLPVRNFITVAIVVAAFISFQPGNTVQAQSSLRESLEQLDRNENGILDPDEVTPLARPFLERIMRSNSRSRSGESFREPIPFSRILESARYYYLQKNGVSGRDVRPRADNSVRPFGLNEDEPVVPGFGISEIRFPYVRADLDQANRIMRQYDFSGDGFIDREEAKHNRWTHRNPFDDDIDGDDRLSKMELTQRYARRRLLAEDSQELYQKDRRIGGEFRQDSSSGNDRSRYSRSRSSPNTWLTSSMIDRFDANRNGRLEESEMRKAGLPTRTVDQDQDGMVTREELQVLVDQLQNDAGNIPEGLPGWFYEKDLDRDNQVAMSEYAEVYSIAKREEFAAFDLNGDGFLTVSEVLKSAWVTGGSYHNDDAQVIPPKRTIISEIEIPDDFLVDDLNVRLSITHTYSSYLDAYLTGPDGQRVELFTAVGSSGDHFNQTVFDDQASNSIQKGRAPFEGSYRPEAIDKKQPGLRAFNGKPIKGVWQLVVRATRSDRFGMLHSWSITAKPSEELPEIRPEEDDESDTEDAAENEKPADETRRPEVSDDPPARKKTPAVTPDQAKEAATEVLKELSEQLDIFR